MSAFHFEGNIPASKSLLNRALIAQSFFPSLKIEGDSSCDDVKSMRSALADFEKKQDIFCHEAGTVLRFMALRVSREPGTWKLTGSERLLQRPHDELVFLLEQLGVSADIFKDHILIQSEGWQEPLFPIQVHREKSSQFASGLLLSAWNLPFDLELDLKSGVSEAYFQMTLNLLQDLGLRSEQKGKTLYVPANQSIKSSAVKIEADMSSAFAIAAAGALAGVAHIKNISEQSLQPDVKFISILKSLKSEVLEKQEGLSISKTENLSGIKFNLNETPDLFPVLAVLCAFADGDSELWGAPHLAFKESNRIEKTNELLLKAGFKTSVKSDGLIIHGKTSKPDSVGFKFDTDHDHRMAFAAALLKLKGFKIEILNPQVVSKSFPEFWQFIGVQP